MSLLEIYHIAEILVSMAVIISVVFVTIELHQNNYVVRKSMGDQREERINWFHKTISTDEDSRKFVHRMVTDFDNSDPDERMRALSFAIRQLWSVLNELEAYVNGQISAKEWQNLRWNMKLYKTLHYIQATWEFIKNGYSPRTHKYWEDLDDDFGLLPERIYAR